MCVHLMPGLVRSSLVCVLSLFNKLSRQQSHKGQSMLGKRQGWMMVLYPPRLVPWSVMKGEGGGAGWETERRRRRRKGSTMREQPFIVVTDSCWPSQGKPTTSTLHDKCTLKIESTNSLGCNM